MVQQLSWIEQRPSKPWVGGSNPSWITKELSGQLVMGYPLLHCYFKLEQACTNLKGLMYRSYQKQNRPVLSCKPLCMCLVRNRTGVFYFVGPYVCALLEIEQACTNLKDPMYRSRQKQNRPVLFLRTLIQVIYWKYYTSVLIYRTLCISVKL